MLLRVRKEDYWRGYGVNIPQLVLQAPNDLALGVGTSTRVRSTRERTDARNTSLPSDAGFCSNLHLLEYFPSVHYEVSAKRVVL